LKCKFGHFQKLKKAGAWDFVGWDQSYQNDLTMYFKDLSVDP